ncbi:MAG: DUF262 domain-containing protein [Porphyromonadaceae bacterium]|mgnify:FL=1|jgi:hypothetical protein|nr:DUF262 domain-containing protein [Porphyromonadaceae bacterium]
MDPFTQISALLAGKFISVPDYQRAYSWDTDVSEEKSKQVNTFLLDLQDYIGSHSATPYYLGHFLFEDRGQGKYAIIDGQQRLTTVVIFIAALYKKLLKIKGVAKVEDLGNDLCELYRDTVKHDNHYHFSTVKYDNRMFREYVIDQTTSWNSDDSDTLSKERIVKAFSYFIKKLGDIGEDVLLKLLRAITHASCTTHVVKNESEAVQMFIFQNNRGKKPTNLEIIKAEFMYHIHLYASSEEKDDLFSEVTERFEHIYRSISLTEKYLTEDSVLSYTVKVHRNRLDDINPLGFVKEQLKAVDDCIAFIRLFSSLLASCFDQTSKFFKQEKENIAYHTLLISSDRSIMFPFIIKAMRNGMGQGDLSRMSIALEQIFLRHRIVKTRADLRWRLNSCYQKVETDAMVVVNHINWMKTATGWWGYWTNEVLQDYLNKGMSHDVAKILLWKYENHLIDEGYAGYRQIRYDSIQDPHLEHIAPKTENQEIDNGYCSYDDEFKERYLERLGNYMLLSGSHNISLSNGRFQQKRESYTHLQQQLEVFKMTEKDKKWDKEKIDIRHKRIVDFLASVL